MEAEGDFKEVDSLPPTFIGEDVLENFDSVLDCVTRQLGRGKDLRREGLGQGARMTCFGSWQRRLMRAAVGALQVSPWV